MIDTLAVEHLLIDDDFGCMIVHNLLRRKKHVKNKKLPVLFKLPSHLDLLRFQYVKV